MSLFDFHTHSHFSTDSRMVPSNIVNTAKKKGLKGIAITDHNTVRGGIEAKKESSSSDFIVIAGSEIMTDVGEIIGLFLNEEISSTDPNVVIDEIKGQGGISVLPHPFRSFLLPQNREKKGIPEEIIKRIQLIEILNSRTRGRDNQKALDLASKMKRPMVTGSDAHFYREVGCITTSIDYCSSEEELRKSLLEGRTFVEPKQYSFLNAVPFILLSGLYSRVRSIPR